MPIITDFGPTVQDYLAQFGSIAFPRPEQCPGCGASHTFIGHGFYPRKPKDQIQVYPIWLKRWFCKACHTTLSILPSFLLRYRHYLLVVIQQVVVARFEDHASWQQTAQRCAPAGAHDWPLVSCVCRAGRRLVGCRAGHVSPPG
jgi:transposase-like protein